MPLPKISFDLPQEKIQAVEKGGFFICSYPRSGNTWTLNLICRILWFQRTTNLFTGQRYPGANVQDLHQCEDVPAVQASENWGGGWKSHDLAVAEKGRMIYVFRHPADTLTSYLHLHRLQKYEGWDKAGYRDVIEYYFEELLQNWRTSLHMKKQRPDQVLITSYEALYSNTPAEILRMAEFLGADTITSDQATAIAKASSFNELAKQEKPESGKERFFRRGKPGAGSEELTTPQRFYIWLKSRSLYADLIKTAKA